MSDTDLITAEGSSDGVELSNPVNSPISEAVSAAPAKATTVVASGDRPSDRWRRSRRNRNRIVDRRHTGITVFLLPAAMRVILAFVQQSHGFRLR